jgi:hypothetical protein
MSDVSRNEKGQLAPGSVLNPTGRPKLDPAINEMKRLQTESFIKIFYESGKLSMAELINRSQAASVTSDEQIILSARIKAANGDTKALNVILDRVIGKALQSIEVSGKDGAPLHSDFEGMTDVELELIADKILKRKQIDGSEKETDKAQ